ncbi:hypothetical protein FVB9288_01705 [Flavobacterium sp. CECT 9288]|jgi:hypothetical protein|uniref:hypothetical protein n=1 Tax=Flavobacterium sp. CECT 9288 TaxID=2845819 RepID=UPI001E2A52D1|nr:hypothetical protein [Flavobacterium sp. CECT 9288]CAH0336033.1 hypothetical protein FVB9288_01705 [Flavobacterium sp. CECT 9288]
MKTITILFLLFWNLSEAQENIFLEADKVPNCGIMKSGKFASTSYSPKEYYMIVKDGIQTEYVENGQYVKSKMEFLNDCEYKTTIIEVTIPNYFAKAGDFLTTKIIQTQCEYIKIKSIMFDKEYEFVYVKMD